MREVGGQSVLPEPGAARRGLLRHRRRRPRRPRSSSAGRAGGCRPSRASRCAPRSGRRGRAAESVAGGPPAVRARRGGAWRAALLRRPGGGHPRRVSRRRVAAGVAARPPRASAVRGLLDGAARGHRRRGCARDCAPRPRLYEEALVLDPRHEDALYYLGQCRRELGRPAEARAAFERLVEVNPSSARGHLALGALLASPDPAEPMDLAAAEVHLRRAHEINGEETGPDGAPRRGAARARAATPRRGEWFEAALRTNPRSVEAAFLAGYLGVGRGQRRDARARSPAGCGRRRRSKAR